MSRVLSKKTLLVLVIVLLAFMTACGGNNGGDSTSNSGQKDNGSPNAVDSKDPKNSDEKVPLNLAIMVGWSVPSMSVRDNQALANISDLLGIDFELTALTIDLYREKLRVMVAGGDIPDAFYWEALDDFTIDLIDSGVVVPLEDYIDQYPNLAAQKHLYKSDYQEHTWAISTVRNPVASGDIPMIRQDWLDNLGLKAPETLDELYEVARAFTYDDPNQSGSKDTYGIQITNTAEGWGLAGTGGIAHAFGLDNDWILQDGKYVPKFATDQFKDYLSWMIRAFNDGLIDPDFAVTDQALSESKVVRRGQAGIYFHYSTRIYDFEGNFQVENLDSRLVGFEAVKGPNGDRGITSRVNLGGVFVSKKAADDPEKMDKIMEWLDFGASEAGGIFWNYGVEGIHYEVDGSGDIVPDAEAFEKDMPRTFVFTQPVQPTEEVYVFPQYTEEAQNNVVQAHQMNFDHIKHNDTSYIFSPTHTKHKSESSNFILDNIIQTIMGAKSVDQWDQVVTDFYNRFEGDQMAQEIADFMGE